MAKTKNTSSCFMCEASSRASVCPLCVNHRLKEYNNNLRLLKSKSNALYLKLSRALMAKGKADDQRSWTALHNEKLMKLKNKLQLLRTQASQGEAKVAKMSHELRLKHKLLESATDVLERRQVEQNEKYYADPIHALNLSHIAIMSERLHKQSAVVKQICKLFPQKEVTKCWLLNDSIRGQYDTVCDACLPRGLDPHSVPLDELSASLGYMVQLLNLVIPSVCAPALHISGFAGSCSRIWQRNSYWDAQPSSGREYQLFIPFDPYKDLRTSNEESSWSEGSSSNFGVVSITSMSNFSPASLQSIEMEKDLQRGISLLKKSVACITAYCYHSLSLEVPSEASTFEAFSRLLATLSSSKNVGATLSSIMVSPSRSSKQGQALNKSVWDLESAIASCTSVGRIGSLSYLRSYLAAAESSYLLKKGKMIEGWDIIEHPVFPPPPSQNEDVEHWTRAIFTDATEKIPKRE